MSRDLKAGVGVILDDSVPNELTAKRKALVCQASVTHPDPPLLISVVGTGDKDLNPVTYESSYVEVLNGYSQILNADGAFTVLADGRVQVNYAGYVMGTAFADVSHTNNNSHVGAVFAITRGGSTLLTARAAHAKVPNAGDIGNISGVGSFLAEVGDIVAVALASDVTGDISIRSSSIVYDWKGE